MQQEQFGSLLRHLLANIHDYAVLEKHPLNELFPRPDSSASRAEHLRRKVALAIEALKPQYIPFDVSTTEWRYYLILYGRYVEGANLIELQNQLALGERQERRLHMRSLTLLEAVLYEQAVGRAALTRPSLATMTDASASTAQEDDPDGAGGGALDVGLDKRLDDEHGEAALFQVAPESLHLRRVVDEVLELCAPRIHDCGAEVVLHFPDNMPSVQADRIILRQILLHLLNTALLTWQQDAQSDAGFDPIVVTVNHLVEFIALEFSWQAGADHPALQQVAQQTPLRYWLEQLHMRLTLNMEAGPPPDRRSGLVHLVLLLPIACQTTLLVVDDHDSAIRIIQRFLQPIPVRVVGETDPGRVPELVRTLRPHALLLDVMMPTTDGWELLQRLKSDPGTDAIPVVVCSVWDVPELALSLGASDFLKKPVDHEHLLETLARLLPPGALTGAEQGPGLQTWPVAWGESSPTGS